MKITALALSLTALALPGAALAQNIANVGWAPTHIITKNAYTDMAASLAEASGGDFTLEVFTGGSLVDVKGTLKGVADGIAQIGFVTGAYLPSDLPLNNVIADLAFVADDAIAAAFAMTEVSFMEPKLNDEWKKNGVLYAGGYSTPVYNFICTKKVETPEDVKGLKIRTAGASHVRWVEHLGGVPVSVPFSEVYTGLQRGSIDCAMSDPTALVSGFKVAEVAKFVTQLPMGTHTSGATYVMNPGWWSKLSADQKTMLFDQFALAIAKMEIDYEAQVKVNIDDAKNMGVEMVAPSAALSDELGAFNKEYVDTLAKVSVETRGVEDPSELIKAYVDAQARWKERLAGIDRTDPQVLADMLKAEVFSKIDLATYGQ